MKKGARLFLLILLIMLLIIPIAFADITIQTNQNIYNLGSKIRASASILQANNFEGLFKLALSCENYKLDYFLTPISLESNFRTAVAVPDLIATSSMLGKCTITGDLMTNDNQVVEEKSSNSFSITNQLNILPVKSKVTSLPGDMILIAGVVNEAFGSNVLKASIKVSLDNSSYIVNAIDGEFNLTLELSKHIKSGKHTIEISASDSKNNVGISSIGLEITAIPTYIKLDLSSAQFTPGSKIGIVSSLYDQADDLINTSLDLELTSPNGNKVFRKVVQSNERIDYESSQYAEPGIYTLVSTYKDMFTQSSMNITSVREVKVKYENETVLIENIGNVLFEDELTFVLESEKKYPVTRKVKIEPGKTLVIDLSREVPFGIYDVIAPIKEGLAPIKEKINETVQGILGSTQESFNDLLPDEGVLAAGVMIHDNRPLYKKVATGLSSITASLVGSDGILAKRPLIAPMVLVAILLVLIVRYGRKPIMRLIKGKKDDDNEEN